MIKQTKCIYVYYVCPLDSLYLIYVAENTVGCTYINRLTEKVITYQKFYHSKMN